MFHPNLSVDRMGENWALFNESGNYINRFALFSLLTLLDKNVEYEEQ